MPRGAGISLSRPLAYGLFFIQRYRFLTIDQFARAAMMKRPTASNQLRSLELAGFLGHFGNTGLGGQGKTPKAYFLTQRGWELLCRESGIPEAEEYAEGIARPPGAAEASEFFERMATQGG